MTLTAPTLLDADEFLDLYGDESGIELVRGEIIRLPMPELEHGYICVNIGSILRTFIKKHKSGRVFGNDSFVRTSEDSVRGADVSYASYQILPADSKKLPKALTPPFELAVEVRSPSDTRKAFLAKGEEYLEAGVQVVLLVEPSTLSATVLRADCEPEKYSKDDTLTLPDILPGFSVRVGEFFE